MAKRLSDYPWVKLFWSEILADTAGMTGDEFREQFLAAHRAWLRNDYAALPGWARSSADYIRGVSALRSSEHKRAQASSSELQPISSPLISSSSSSSQKEEGSGEKEAQRLPKKSEVPKPEWVTDFNVYLRESEPHFDRLILDWAWVAEKKEYHRNALIRKTVERLWFEYWGTKAGWERKKQMAWDRQHHRWRELDWERTITNNLRRSLVYLGKGERDEEADWVERCRSNANKV